MERSLTHSARVAIRRTGVGTSTSTSTRHEAWGAVPRRGTGSRAGWLPRGRRARGTSETSGSRAAAGGSLAAQGPAPPAPALPPWTFWTIAQARRPTCSIRGRHWDWALAWRAGGAGGGRTGSSGSRWPATDVCRTRRARPSRRAPCATGSAAACAQRHAATCRDCKLACNILNRNTSRQYTVLVIVEFGALNQYLALRKTWPTREHGMMRSVAPHIHERSESSRFSPPQISIPACELYCDLKICAQPSIGMWRNVYDILYNILYMYSTIFFIDTQF